MPEGFRIGTFRFWGIMQHLYCLIGGICAGSFDPQPPSLCCRRQAAARLKLLFAGFKVHGLLPLDPKPGEAPGPFGTKGRQSPFLLQHVRSFSIAPA